MQINAKISANPTLKSLKTKVKKAIDLSPLAKRFQNRVKSNARSMFKKRSGKLGYGTKIEPIKDGFRISNDMPHASIQDIGGTIKPKHGKYLAIPIGNRIGTPRKFSDLVCIKTHNNLFLIKKGSKEFFYVLKKQVVIRGTRWWTDGIVYLKAEFTKMQSKIGGMFR